MGKSSGKEEEEEAANAIGRGSVLVLRLSAIGIWVLLSWLPAWGTSVCERAPRPGPPQISGCPEHLSWWVPTPGAGCPCCSLTGEGGLRLILSSESQLGLPQSPLRPEVQASQDYRIERGSLPTEGHWAEGQGRMPALW